ncbi:MAG: hypothetical protein K8S16_11490, partial [Bacteroidales bacterium]|nr:hypothetical protein [Bacteroidales bacterium]
MKKYLDLIIEKFEEKGQVYYLATSKDVQGLIAQGDSIEEAIDIARDLVVDLIELREKKNNEQKFTLRQVPETFHYPLIFNT